MPTVPIVDQTAMGSDPYTAPGVAPMRNDAPQQTQALGQATQQAGELAYSTGQTIGDALAAQVDDAKVKAAESSALSQAQQINSDPQTGFLNQRGQNAIDQYEPAKQAVTKAFQSQLDGLSNPIQQHMFQQVMNQHLRSVGQQMADHNFQETSRYAGEAAVSRANVFSDAASNASSSYGQTDADGNATGDFAKNVATAEQETLNATRILKGAPADSDVAKEALLNLHTHVGTSVVMQMMDARAPYAKVQQVYADMQSKGWLDLQAANTLGRMVKTYSEQEMVRTAVNQNLSDAVRGSQKQPTSSTGTPDYQFAVKGATITTSPYDPESGGVTVSVANGTPIQAPADGTVTQAGKDDDGNFSLQIQHADGSETTLSGLSASNVKVGDRVQGGENVALSGAVDGQNPGVVWSLADKDGNAVDPTKAGLAPVDLTKVTDEKVLGAALDSVRQQIKDPYLQQQATAEMESMVRHNQGMQNAQQTQMYKQAADSFYGANYNWRAIPQSLFHQLTPEQQQDFKQKQTEHAMQQVDQANFWKTQSETGAVSNFYANPSDITVDNVQSAYSGGNLTRETYLRLMDQAGKMDTDKTAVAEATHLKGRIQFIAGPAGINVYPITNDDRAKLNDLTTKVSDDLAYFKSQNNGKATPDQVDALIRNEVQQRTIVVPRYMFSPMRMFSGPSTTAQGYQYQTSIPDVDTSSTSATSAPDYKYIAINPVTKLPMQSMDGKTWLDVKSGKKVDYQSGKEVQ